MALDPDPRADALACIAALEARLAAHAQEAGALRDELAGVRAAVEAIPVAPETPPESEPVVPELARVDAGADVAGARLVALDLILRGVPRDEAVLRLAADYPGVDAAALVDEAATSRG